MTKYYAKVLPDQYRAEQFIENTVPLIDNHNIFKKALGTATIVDDRFAIIESDDERVHVGTKLSSGCFDRKNGIFEIREVSITKSPVFSECAILKEVTDD